MSTTYQSLLGGMWAPEGSEMNDRLKRLQELERTRKEREAKRAEILRGSGMSNTDTTSTRRSRLNRLGSRGDDSDSNAMPTRQPFGYRRTMSQRERSSQENLTDEDHYGGARPKSSASNETEDDIGNMFSSVVDSVLGPRRPIGEVRNNNTGFTSSARYDRPSYTDRPYSSTRSYVSRSQSKPEGDGSDIFGDIVKSTLESTRSDTNGRYETRSSRRRFGKDSDTTLQQADPSSYTSNGSSYTRDPYRNYYNDENYNTEEGDTQEGEQQTIETTEEVHEYEEDDEGEGEEPRHFIERLRQGNNGSPHNNGLHQKRAANNDYIVSTIPSVPPLKRVKAADLEHDKKQYDDVPDLIHPTEDILTVAQDINATFGIKSPRLSSSKSPDGKERKSEAFDFSASETNNKELHNGSSNMETDSNGDVVFSASSPEKSASKVKRTNSKRKSKTPVVKNRENIERSNYSSPAVNTSQHDSSVTYEFEEVSDDSGDERGKMLPVRESFYQTGISDWDMVGQSPGKLDQMHGFFSGKVVDTDPTITRLLNGNMVKAELDKSVSDDQFIRTSGGKKDEQTHQMGPMSNLKNAFDNLVQFDSNGSNKSNSSGSSLEREVKTNQDMDKNKKNTIKNDTKTSSKDKKGVVNKKGVVGKHKALEKVKSASNKSKSSDSDESFQTASESESESRGSRSRSPASRNSTPRKNMKKASNKSSEKTENSMSLSDKLAKLESMTEEKSRRLSVGSVGSSVGDFEGKKGVPSYMSGTSSSQMKQSRTKGAAPKAGGDLVKDVRDLRKYVRENSEPNTPTASPRRRSFRDTSTERVMTEIGVQTDFKNENVIVVYVCKHCGKSSDEKIEQTKIEKAKEHSLTMDGKTGNKKLEEKVVEKEKAFHNEKKKAPDAKSSGRITPKPELRSSGRETPKSYLESNGTEEKNNSKPKNAGASRSYMKGTASSQLKNSNSSTSADRQRKSSVPDVVYKSKGIDNDTQKQSTILSGKSSVSQRAKDIDNASKAGGGKMKLSVFKTYGSEKKKTAADAETFHKTNFSNTQSRLTKSKSVEQVSLLKGTYESVEQAKNNLKFETKDAVVGDREIEQQSDKVPSSSSEQKSQTEILKKSQPPAFSPKPAKQSTDSEKLNIQITSLSSPRSVSPFKPLALSPRSPSPSGSFSLTPRSQSPSKPAGMSPRSTGSIKPPLSSPQTTKSDNFNNDDEKNVDSSGVFTTLEKNPFIKNDIQRRNSLKGRNDGESVWERSGSKSRDSSLKRSNSFKESDKPTGKDHPLKRSNTSAGERSSLTHLSWSDSGSSGSLHGGSRSSHHGSNSSLSKDSDSVFRRERTSSTTSQNSVLNLLSPAGTVCNTVTGVMETDVDAAYDAYVKTENNNNILSSDEHNEDSVNRAHLDFAKQACNLLEFDAKKRDSSIEIHNDDANQEKQNSDTTNSIQNTESNTMNNGHLNRKVEHVGKKEYVRQSEIKIEEQPLATRKVGSSGAGSHGNKPSLSGSQGYQAEFNEDGEELVKQTRVNMMDWDPAKLLAELYKVTMMPDNIQDISHKFIGMEGLMEKLPMNKKKATLLKTWKRRFFKAKDGWLHYYETNSRDKPSDSLQLMGGKVEELGPRVLGVDDGRGKYLMVRVPTDNEYGQWKVALESQTADNVKATYVRPAPASTPHPKKKVVIIDIGSSAIRAGILGERPTLPHVFFPSTAAVNKKTGEIIVGADAFRPDVRRTSNIVYPIRPTNKVDKGFITPFNIDMDVMTAVFNKVFTDLGVNPKQYMVMLSTPQNLGDKLMEGLMKILVDRLHVRGACMVQQSLLALYSYNATSGVIVDIGERLEILPIYDGLLIEGGLSRQAYGGAKIQDSLYISLLENRYKFNTPVERWLVRHLCEKMCYVSDNYKDSKKDCDKDPASFIKTVDLHDFSLPEGAQDHVELDYACFKSPEGFFNTDLWEMDYKNIQKQIYAAIQQCPMDARKQMYRSVYLSGGVTTIPGFAARLELELRKLAPPAAIVEVHAAPQRYHAAYVGACAVASMDVFEMSCVSAEEWNKLGVKACKKWGTG